jgi:uncharacterized surface protein with fasciclin (FAS1) repeats
MKAKIYLFFYVFTITSAIMLATAIAQEQQVPTKHPPVEPLKDLVETASTAGTFNTFLKGLEVSGLKETLKGAGPYTVFAPTDEAFAKLPAGTLDRLLKDKEQLKKVLLHHVISGSVAAKDVMSMKSATSLEGSTLSIEHTENKVLVDRANIIQTDIAATNGTLHAIDNVLMPVKVTAAKK